VTAARGRRPPPERGLDRLDPRAFRPTPRPRVSLPRAADRVALRSGLRVSPLCLGMVKDPRTVLLAHEAGINFFFLTADLHFPAYDALRAGLRDLMRRRARRDEVVLVAASYVAPRPFVAAAVSELVSALAPLDAIDLVVAGGIHAHDVSYRLGVLRDLRERPTAGARGVGASFHDRRAAARALGSNLLDVAFVRYNPLHLGAKLDLFPAWRAKSGVPLYNFNSTAGYLGRGANARLGLDARHWVPTAGDYYRFALMRPEITGVLCAPGTPAELTHLLRSIERGPLAADEEQHLMAMGTRAAARGLRARPASA
jgi:hypothetical protein